MTDDGALSRVRTFTRKLHNYLGLYLLCFVWLFSISGLVLNHSKWSVAQFWNKRNESVTSNAIRIPVATGDVTIASELMGQLSLVGEVGDIRRSADGRHFNFQVVRPGRVDRVEVRLDSAAARVTRIRLNAWGVLDALHHFTGVKMDDSSAQRDWWLTRVWSLAIDALSLGLIVLVVSGMYLWFRLHDKRKQGLAALVLGVGTCAFFLYGIGAVIAS